MPTHLPLDEHLAALVRSGSVLRDAAARAGLDAPVPTCPEWDVRALVTHQGTVHRWAAAALRGDGDHRTADSEAEAAATGDLFGWFSHGWEALVDTIRATDDDATAMVFLDDAPPPRRFWARRQAHETTIHSADAVAAVHKAWPTAADLTLGSRLAADGVDELLCGFLPRRGSALAAGGAMTLLVAAEDTGHAWTVRSDGESISVAVGQDGSPDATLTGPAVALYLGLWNRGNEITAHGRDDLVPRWRDLVRIRSRVTG